MNNDLYSDYIRRQPHPRAEVLIKRWHGRLLSRALHEVQMTPEFVLEIGPGHGYFAEMCSKKTSTTNSATQARQ